MSVYDREWYRKEEERRQHQQEGADAMWNEVEPSRKTGTRNVSKGRNNAASTRKNTAPATPSDKLIPSCCPLCGFTTQVRVPYQQLKAYSYSCPACKTKISVSTGENKDKTTSTIFTIMGILALAIYALSQWNNIMGLFM